MSGGQSGYVFVCADEYSRSDGVELPTEEDGTLLLSVLQSQFESASGLKYRNPTTGGWRAVKLVDGTLCPPTKEGWGEGVYVVVVSMPKSTSETGNSETDTAVTLSSANAPSVGYTNSGSSDGYKRKLEDDDGGERATKNPRSSSPDYYGQTSSQAKQSSPPPPPSRSPGQSGQTNMQDLIVLGLEFKATDDDLKNYFKQFGELTHAEVKKDAAGKSRGFGFVRFADADIQRKVYTMRHAIKDRRVELRVPRQSPGYFPSKLFVGCLPLKPEVTTDELSEYFGRYGKLDDVYIPRPYRGFGFVSFNDPQVVQRILKETHTLRSSSLNVTPADPKGSVRGGGFGAPQYPPHYPPGANYDPYQQQQQPSYYSYGYGQAPQQTSGTHYAYAGPPQSSSYGYGYQSGNYPPPPPPPQGDKQVQGYVQQHRSYPPTAGQQRLSGSDLSRPAQQPSGYHYSQPPASYTGQSQTTPTAQSYQYAQQRTGVDRGHYGYGVERTGYGVDQRSTGYQRDGQTQQQQQGHHYDPKSTWQNY